MSTAQAAYALTGDSRRLIAPLVLLAAEASSNQVWINVANAGEWEGHPAGPFRFTADVFDRIIANATGRSTPINCDYEHQTFKKGVSGAVPSSGKILKLERRGDELWALAELTPRAAQLVRDGEYRSCSPVIEFDSKDRVSGKDIGPEMLSLALTNDPFQDGLAPIRLTRSADMADDPKPKDDKATCMATPAAEGTPAEESAESPAEEQNEIDANSVFDALAEAAGADKAAVLAAIADNMDAIVKLVQDKLSSGDGNASEGKAMSRIAAQAGDIRTLRTELRVKDKTLVQLTARLEKLEAKHAADLADASAKEGERVKAHVLSLQKTGHVGPTSEDVDDAVALFSSNWERAARTYSRQVIPLGEPEGGEERNRKSTIADVTTDQLSEVERATVVALSAIGMNTKEQTRLLSLLREGKSAGEAAKVITAERSEKKAS